MTTTNIAPEEGATDTPSTFDLALQQATAALNVLRGASQSIAAACDQARRTLAPVAVTPPPIGQSWAEQGGIYAGITRGVDGQPDAHLILSTVEASEPLDWQRSIAWAEALRDEGLADWHVPTRAESALLFANLRDQFAPEWHWTSEQHSRTYAWLQAFDGGSQGYLVKSFKARARAVRRLMLQSFNPSTAAA